MIELGAHRIRRQTLRGRAATPAAAFALRAALRRLAEGGLNEALSDAFEAFAPDQGPPLHLPRLELTLRLGAGEDLERVLPERLGELARRELERLLPAPDPARPSAPPSAPPSEIGRARTSGNDAPARGAAAGAATFAAALESYLTRGDMAWPLAGVEPGALAARLGASAMASLAELARRIPPAAADARLYLFRLLGLLPGAAWPALAGALLPGPGPFAAEKRRALGSLAEGAGELPLFARLELAALLLVAATRPPADLAVAAEGRRLAQALPPALAPRVAYWLAERGVGLPGFALAPAPAPGLDLPAPARAAPDLARGARRGPDPAAPSPEAGKPRRRPARGAAAPLALRARGLFEAPPFASPELAAAQAGDKEPTDPATDGEARRERRAAARPGVPATSAAPPPAPRRRPRREGPARDLAEPAPSPRRPPAEPVAVEADPPRDPGPAARQAAAEPDPAAGVPESSVAWPWAEPAPDARPWPIAQAGLVLLHPYLPLLFERLGCREGRGLSPARLARAAAALDYLAKGHEQVHEFGLGLAKVLLGLAPQSPLPIAAGLLDERDRAEADELLRAVIGHWPALKSTSPAGLRHSFLLRRGFLRAESRGDLLQVEGAAWDVLLGRLPWAIGVVRLPWMARTLYTEWPSP